MSLRQTRVRPLRRKTLCHLVDALVIDILLFTLPGETDALVKQLVEVEVVSGKEAYRI